MDQEELVQEEHPRTSEESYSLCRWLAHLAKLGHHISLLSDTLYNLYEII